MTSPLSSMAEAYASHGWPLFPLHSPGRGSTSCDCGRNCGKDAAKHPRTRHGLLDASTDLAVVRQWWSAYPLANVGIVTGGRSGLVVLDVDVRSGGDVSLCALTDEYGPLPDTAAVLTGGGGLHYYFSHPGGVIRNSAGKLGAGLDIRGDGGYVVAPPSVHACGVTYTWATACDPAPLPAWLHESTAAGEMKALDTAAVLSGVLEGERDDTLFRLACKLRRADVPRDVADDLLLRSAAACTPPFPASDALRTVASVYERYQPTPEARIIVAPKRQGLRSVT